MVVGLWLLSIGLPLIYIYISMIILSLISIVIFLMILNHHDTLVESNGYILFGHINTNPDVEIESNFLTWKMLKRQIKEWKNWFKILFPFGIVVLCNYFMMQAFAAVPFYIFLSGKVPLVDGVWINRDLLFSITGILWMIGAFLAFAMLHYSKKIKDFVLNYPSIILLMHVCGAVLSSCAFFIQPLL
eukprot:UN03235